MSYSKPVQATDSRFYNLSPKGPGYMTLQLPEKLVRMITKRLIKTFRTMVILQHELVFEGIKPDPHTPGEDILELNGNRKALYQPSIDDFKKIKFNEDYISKADRVLVYKFLDALKAFLSQTRFVQDMIHNNKSLFSIESVAMSIMSSFNENPNTSKTPQAVHVDFSPDILAPIVVTDTEGKYFSIYSFL